MRSHGSIRKVGAAFTRAVAQRDDHVPLRLDDSVDPLGLGRGPVDTAFPQHMYRFRSHGKRWFGACARNDEAVTALLPEQRPSAIWLRAELPVHRNSTRIGYFMCAVSRLSEGVGVIGNDPGSTRLGRTGLHARLRLASLTVQRANAPEAGAHAVEQVLMHCMFRFDNR